MPEVASKEYIDRRLERMEQSITERMERLITQVGKPERMTSQEVAEEWGVCRKTAINRLKKMYRKGNIEKVDFDSKPITVNRKEFFEAINL